MSEASEAVARGAAVLSGQCGDDQREWINGRLIAHRPDCFLFQQQRRLATTRADAPGAAIQGGTASEAPENDQWTVRAQERAEIGLYANAGLVAEP